MNIPYKTNKQFMLMTFFGILFMLDDHSGKFVGFLTNLFPYNSFYMPMFFFISGYFFNPIDVKANFVKYLNHKTKKLLVPFIIVNFFSYFAVFIFNFAFKLHWKTTFPFKELLLFLSTGTVIDLSSSTWFLIALFESLLVYAFFRTLFYRVWDDSFALLLYLLISCFSVYFSTKGYSKNVNILPFLKISFFLVYLQLGQFIKKYENLFVKHYYAFIVMPVICNAVILTVYSQQDICFNSLAFMQGFQTTNYLLPFFTSLSGILFYYSLSHILSSSLGDIHIVNIISNHSLYILCFHLLFFNILNGIFSSVENSAYIFDHIKFSNTAWYIYDYRPVFKFYYFTIGLVGSLLTEKVVNRLKLVRI